MARKKNDGRGRLGGRAKGTPNKITTSLKDWIVEVVDSNREQMIRDLSNIEPLERLKILERLMSYVISKPSTGVTIATTPEQKLMGEIKIGFDE